MLAALALLLLPAAQSQELTRRECRDRLEAFYAEPAQTCSPAAEAAQTARVAATTGRNQPWGDFFAACETAHQEFLAVEAGCDPKFMEGFPNEDWRERWGKLEAIEADVAARLLGFGCARDRDPLLDELTECRGTGCAKPVERASVWADRCKPEALPEEAAGIGYRKSFELLAMLREEGTARIAHAELVTRVGEAVQGSTADGLQRALAAPWCTDDKSWTCALGASWSGDAPALIGSLRAFRGGELERTRLGRSRLTGVRDARRRLLLEQELRPQVLGAPVGEGVAESESPTVRRTWSADDRTRAMQWAGVRLEGARVFDDRDAADTETVSRVHGEAPWAVAFELERTPSDLQSAMRRIRASLSDDDLRARYREPGRGELVYRVSEDTEVVYVVTLDGRDAVVTRFVENVPRAKASARARSEAALTDWLAAGDLPVADAFTTATQDFGDKLSPTLADAIDLHVRLLAATGDQAGWTRRLETLAPQLDLWVASREPTPEEEAVDGEEVPEDPDLVDPDADTGPATPRSRVPAAPSIAKGGCAEAAWSEAVAATHAEAEAWHRDAVWAELRLAMGELRGEDMVDAARRYRFAMYRLAEIVRQRDEAARLAGERDAYLLKAGMERLDRGHPALGLAAMIAESECE